MINAFGPVYGYLGYNCHARNFFEALDPFCEVAVVPSYPNLTHYPVSEKLATLIERQAMMSLKDPSICIQYGNELHKFSGGYRIGFPVFEYTKLPDDWLNLMRQVNEIWTPSNWSRDVLIQNGFSDEKIVVIPEGVNPDLFHPSSKGRANDKYTFLSVGKWEKRKGQVEVLKAWAELFAENESVELIVYWPCPFIKNFSLESEIKKMGLGPFRNIHSVQGKPTDQEMAQLYQMADCFVLPSRGEGWGLTIMEAMASGLPVITTGYSAPLDYAHNINAYLLDVKDLIPVFDPPFFPNEGECGVWAEIDLNQLKSLLWHVYQNPEEAKEKGRRAAQDMKEKWKWEDAAQKAFKRLCLEGLVEPALKN